MARSLRFLLISLHELPPILDGVLGLLELVGLVGVRGEFVLFGSEFLRGLESEGVDHGVVDVVKGLHELVDFGVVLAPGFQRHEQGVEERLEVGVVAFLFFIHDNKINESYEYK